MKALLYNAQLESIHSVHSASKKSSPESDVQVLDPTHCRSMDANDWKLTFMDSFASETEVSSNVMYCEFLCNGSGLFRNTLI